MLTYKILGVLLMYPSEEMQQNILSMQKIVKEEGLLPQKDEKALCNFMNTFSRRELLSIQEDYCGIFDRSRGNSLHLFEHVHGESRDRGQAMVDLIDHYKEKGLELKERELPDYLPVFLEFLSKCTPAEAKANLDEIVHIIAAVGAKLGKKTSDYHVVFRAIEKMTDARIDRNFVIRALEEEDARDNSLEALDKEWEETPAFDRTGAPDCTACPSHFSTSAARASHPASPAKS